MFKDERICTCAIYTHPQIINQKLITPRQILPSCVCPNCLIYWHVLQGKECCWLVKQNRILHYHEYLFCSLIQYKAAQIKWVLFTELLKESLNKVKGLSFLSLSYYSGLRINGPYHILVKKPLNLNRTVVTKTNKQKTLMRNLAFLPCFLVPMGYCVECK